MVSQWAVGKTHSSSRMRAVSLGSVVFLFALIAAPVAQGCSPSDPKIVTVPINSPQVSLYINMFGTAGNSFFTINGAASDQSWAQASSILQHFGVVWTIDPAGLPPGISCANLTVPLTEIVPTACFRGIYPSGRGCPYGVYDPATQTDGSCQYPAIGTPTTGTGSTTCISYYTGVGGQINVNVTASTSVTMVDPIPNLVSGNAVKNSAQLQTLLTKGRTVKGVAADGVTEVVVRISTNSPGEQFKLTLLNDQQGQNSLPNEDGALGNPGATSFSQNQLTITAGNADSNGLAYAFAVYRTPVDFARPTGTGTFKSGACNGTTLTDDNLACRSVSLQIQDVTANTALPSLPITILRPPLVLIHGLWSDWDGAWKNFSPLVTGKNSADSRFYIGRVNYKNRIIPAITATNPTLSSSGSISRIFSNALGFVYNAPSVAQQIGTLLGDFKNGHNPLNIPVAAIQPDIVAHSMGGLVTRQLVLVPNFLDSSTNPTNNLNLGYIHKIITIDTPHLGSPLAAKLVDSANPHFREFFEFYGQYSLSSVTLSNGTSPSGAMADMKGNGVAVDSSLSAALQTLAMQGPRSLPAALVAGNYTNWSSLDCTFQCTPARIRSKGPNEPLSQSLTSTGWPGNFGTAPNNINDGLVGVTSQLNGLTSSNLLFTGLAHSTALIGSYTGLGFTAPSVLDSATGTPPNPIAQKVVDLLNTPVTQPPFSQTVINP
jgi:hypothetical protein